MNTNAPLIIVGCGRSGSTLLDRMLNCHPAIHMLGETNFLCADLWKLLNSASDKSMWNAGARRAYAKREQFVQKDNASSEDSTETDSSKIEAQRVAQLVREAMGGLFRLSDVEKRFWGMKEIWNGDVVDHDWHIYDLVFPHALWLHVTRHPLSYARSAIGWNKEDSAVENAQRQLRTWARISQKSIELADRKDYFLIRYEDLIRDPRACLTGVLARLGLDWDDECLRPLQQHWVATKNLPILEYQSLAAELSSPELSKLMQLAGYDLDSLPDQPERSYSGTVEKDAKGRLVISGRIQKGIGPYWIFDLTTSPAIRDDLEASGANPSLDGCQLYEDGKALNRWPEPDKFQASAPGSFYSTEVSIVFTTSDGSDPLSNGRIYSISMDRRDVFGR
jgi:hypothetical protein